MGLKRNKLHCPIVNLDKLVSLLPEDQRVPPEGKASVLDVTKHGFFKVLGKGHLPKVPMIVKAGSSAPQPRRRSKKPVARASSPRKIHRNCEEKALYLDRHPRFKRHNCQLFFRFGKVLPVVIRFY